LNYFPQEIKFEFVWNVFLGIVKASIRIRILDWPFLGLTRPAGAKSNFDCLSRVTLAKRPELDNHSKIHFEIQSRNPSINLLASNT
jgi:hypothetical protein